MRKNAGFKKNYMQSMADLKGSENKPGQALSSLFRDYLEISAEWKPGPTENFKEIFKTARTFVLPMNPPRFELEYAVKKFLAAKGITIKRILPKPALEGEKPAAKRKRRRKPRATNDANKGNIRTTD